MDNIGAERNMATGMYQEAAHAPNKEMVDDIVARYGPNQVYYLPDLTTTSPGAKRQITAAPGNHTRAVESQKMLEKVVMMKRKNFTSRKLAEMACRRPALPVVESKLASVINYSHYHSSSVTFIDITKQLEGTITIRTDAAVSRRRTLNTERQTPSTGCWYLRSSSGYPSYHYVAVLCDKYGSINLRRFIFMRHLTGTKKEENENINYGILPEFEVD